MRWPWSRSDPLVPGESVPGPPRTGSGTSFRGVSREEVLSHGLYEVMTTGGVPVRLHDMSFVSLTYEPGPPPSLVLRFVYEDPEWTPEAAVDTPMAVFRFGDAVVLHHEDKPVDPDTPAHALRQVGGFDYDEATSTFALSSFTTYIVFTAATLTLAFEPSDR